MNMTKRAAKAVYYLHKKAVTPVVAPATDATKAVGGLLNGLLTASFLGAGALGLGVGALVSKTSSPTDVDMDNARKEYRSSSLDAAIAELSSKLRNERMALQPAKGTQTMQKAMRLV